MKRVVITGMGAITPLGNNVATYWAGLKAGISGAKPITKFDASAFKTRFACEVTGFDPLDYFDKSEMRKYDLYAQYALASVQQAVIQAGLADFNGINKDRAGVVWGTEEGGVSTAEEQLAEYHHGDGTPRFSPFFISKRIANMASGLVSIKYGLRGVNYTTLSACASSNTAIINAFNCIRWGKADIMITGGSEASITPGSIGGFNAAKALSTANDDYLTASKPFDSGRDGFVFGEGGGALVLESLEHAVRRSAPILGELIGGGMAADAYHITGTHPAGDGALLGMQLALEEAGIGPEEIDFICAHATSTPMGDLSELHAIGRLLGDGSKASISAPKSMTGHLLGAAGAVQAIACVKALAEDIVPPTINVSEAEPAFADRLDLTIGQAKVRPVRIAVNNAFGFGGHIACTVFKKWEGR